MPLPLLSACRCPTLIARLTAVSAGPSTSLALASSSACVISRGPLSSAIAASVTGLVTGASFTGVTWICTVSLSVSAPLSVERTVNVSSPLKLEPALVGQRRQRRVDLRLVARQCQRAAAIGPGRDGGAARQIHRQRAAEHRQLRRGQVAVNIVHRDRCHAKPSGTSSFTVSALAGTVLTGASLVLPTVILKMSETDALPPSVAVTFTAMRADIAVRRRAGERPRRGIKTQPARQRRCRSTASPRSSACRRYRRR